MSNLTYSAETKPGQGINLSDLKMVKGWNGQVKRGDRVVCESGLFATKGGAERWAIDQAKRFRAYRQENGEGIEDVEDRKREAKHAAQRRHDRIRRKTAEMYELLTALAGDGELVREWLPAQALTRLEKVRELIAFVETDAK